MNLTAKQIGFGDLPAALQEQMTLLDQPRRLAERIAPKLAYHWQDHLKDFPRRDGPFKDMPKTGFGEAVSESVHDVPTGSGFLLRANYLGIRQRYYGGTIRAKNKKVLCFGVKPESYGRSYSEVKRALGIDRKMATVTETNKRGQLVTRRRKLTEDENKDRRQYLRSLFGFARQVTQQPNPNVIPPDLGEVTVRELNHAIAAIKGRQS